MHIPFVVSLSVYHNPRNWAGEVRLLDVCVCVYVGVARVPGLLSGESRPTIEFAHDVN